MKYLLAAFFITATASSLFAGKQDGKLDIYWIDVEGGAATLIVTPDGESVLIDTGNPGRRDADRIVQVAGREAKLRKIDHLIITHYHRDHYGGAATLATLMPIGVVYDNGKFDGMPDNPGAAYFNFKCDKRVVAMPGEKLPLKSDEVNITFIAARKTFVDDEDATDNASQCSVAKPKDRDGSDNANSVGIILRSGKFDFFDAGDLTWNQEAKLVCPKNQVGEVDVYQVTHHGLDSSNNPVLIQSLKPRVTVMNNGVTKGCKPAVFAALQATSSIQAMYQVHKNMRPDGNMHNTIDEHIANRGKADCDGNYIKLSVSKDKSNYTVSIPANNHAKTYETK